MIASRVHTVGPPRVLREPRPEPAGWDRPNPSLLVRGRRGARPLGVVSQQRHQLEGSMERVSNHREVVD